MSQEIPLPALREDNPRDFLAALGLLAVFRFSHPEKEILLRWDIETQNPTIFCETGIPDDWLQTHCEWVAQQFLTDDLPPDLAKEIRTWLNVEYASKSQKFIREEIQLNSLIFGATAKTIPSIARRLFEFDADKSGCSSHPSLATSLRASLISQCHDEKPDTKKRIFKCLSDFSMANKQGQKYLLLGAQRIARDWYQPALVEACLAGNQELIEEAPSLRFSHLEGRDAAYFGTIPTYADLPPLNLLALLGLTLYPVVDSLNHAVTTGFYGNQFRWPIWSDYLGFDVIRTLLHSSAILTKNPSSTDLRATGVRRLWQSRRYEANKSLFFARPKPAF